MPSGFNDCGQNPGSSGGFNNAARRERGTSGWRIVKPSLGFGARVGIIPGVTLGKPGGHVLRRRLIGAVEQAGALAVLIRPLLTV